MALAAVRPSRLPAAPARVVLLLPAQQPSFECAYLAAVGVAAATSLARRPSGSPASRFLFEVKRCKQLVGNAACLLVGQCSSLVEAEASPGTSEASDSVWGGALSVSRRHSELSEVLCAGHSLLRADARPSLEATSTSSGKFTPEDRSSLMNLELSQQIRAACGDPAQLGPLVGVLSSRLRKLSSSEKGSSSDVVFFGGKSPSLISDIPLAGSLLTSASWCRRVAEALEPSDNGKCLEKLKARKLEAPLKGMDLVLFWLLQIMDDAPAQAALAACQAMALQRPGEPALAWPWEDSGADSEDADDRLMPSEFLQYLDTVRPPLGQVCADDLLTLQQQRGLAQHQEAAVLAGKPLIEAVQRGDVNQVRHLLLVGAKVDIQYHTKHHSLGLVHLAAALGISPPEGREYAKDHPASLIAADLQIQLYQVRNPSAEDGGVAILKLLVEAKCGLDIQDSDGSTPCFYAAMAGNVRCLEYILQAGGQQTFGTLDFLQRSDLYWATSNDQPHTVRWLLENVQGAKVDGQSRQGRTPLAKAAWSDLPECAQILIQHKADPRVVDDHGRTVLHMASWGPLGGRRGGKFVNGRAAGASPRCIELLLRSPEGRSCLVVGDRDLGTPLAIASATGALDAIEAIVACEEGRMQVLKHPPTAIDFVPLAAASFRGHEGCLRKLLEVLGDPSMRGKHTGRSALDFAVIGQQLSIVMLLAERLAKMTCCDGPGFANSNATPAISDVSNINNIRNMHPTDQGSLLLQSDSGCNSVSQLELVDLFVSAMRWALWTGVSPMVETLARACPPAVEAQDFLLLCLIAGPSCTPPVVWPPFPQI
ncbi:unnamed protein product [Polarella glacialis]|uniref:Uncharacterized protein n=1 Tax=Polarella glacialis TaxID=89957 RepID=A0A813LQE3_POLGL|nr:unnamed protein product [Polarella glacialis]